MHDADDPETASTEAGESLYRRWSRRKQRARDAHADDEPAPPVTEERDPAPPPAQQEARVLGDADMPDLDTLGEDDDYSPFLSPGVSEALRTRALRKLFASRQFNVLDGLNDYDEDFTTFEALGDIVTSDMRHRMEVEAREAEERAAAEARAASDGAPPPEEASETVARTDAAGEPAGAPSEEADQSASADADPAPAAATPSAPAAAPGAGVDPTVSTARRAAEAGEVAGDAEPDHAARGADTEPGGAERDDA